MGSQLGKFLRDMFGGQSQEFRQQLEQCEDANEIMSIWENNPDKRGPIEKRMLEIFQSYVNSERDTELLPFWRKVPLGSEPGQFLDEHVAKVNGQGMGFITDLDVLEGMLRDTPSNSKMIEVLSNQILRVFQSMVETISSDENELRALEIRLRDMPLTEEAQKLKKMIIIKTVLSSDGN